MYIDLSCVNLTRKKGNLPKLKDFCSVKREICRNWRIFAQCCFLRIKWEFWLRDVFNNQTDFCSCSSCSFCVFTFETYMNFVPTMIWWNEQTQAHFKDQIPKSHFGWFLLNFYPKLIWVPLFAVFDQVSAIFSTTQPRNLCEDLLEVEFIKSRTKKNRAKQHTKKNPGSARLGAESPGVPRRNQCAPDWLLIGRRDSQWLTQGRLLHCSTVQTKLTHFPKDITLWQNTDWGKQQNSGFSSFFDADTENTQSSESNFSSSTSGCLFFIFHKVPQHEHQKTCVHAGYLDTNARKLHSGVTLSPHLLKL